MGEGNWIGLLGRGLYGRTACTTSRVNIARSTLLDSLAERFTKSTAALCKFI